ncbi:MAG: nucleoside phosphorylase [Legionella sp.]|nr:nucleoside phosphorylase [Legionella sp.]
MESSLNVHHINATIDSLKGNHGLGRYVFLTGSDNRAREISEHFSQVVVLPHPRQHNLYLGTLSSAVGNIDVASISTGMGGPSADIIINELIIMGARRFLRVGTAGSLQPDSIKVGDSVIATGAVRDDKASWDYIYKEYPAIASLEYLIASGRAASATGVNTHFGIVHSKSSLYARELHLSLIPENDNYMDSMHKAGVLATEMECAQLFVLASLMSARLLRDKADNHPVLGGCILAIIGDRTSFSSEKEVVDSAIAATILLSLETTRELFLIDTKRKSVF